MTIRAAVLTACLLLPLAATAADPKPMATTQPVRITAAQARGPVFAGPHALKSDDSPDGPVTDVALLRSKDHRYEAGLYQAGPSEQDIAAYPEDEFFFIIEGTITLTSADGTVLAAKAGEGVAIPKGWKGHWSTPGYRKYYVTYDGAAK